MTNEMLADYMHQGYFRVEIFDDAGVLQSVRNFKSQRGALSYCENWVRMGHKNRAKLFVSRHRYPDNKVVGWDLASTFYGSTEAYDD